MNFQGRKDKYCRGKESKNRLQILLCILIQVTEEKTDIGLSMIGKI